MTNTTGLSCYGTGTSELELEPGGRGEDIIGWLAGPSARRNDQRPAGGPGGGGQ